MYTNLVSLTLFNVNFAEFWILKNCYVIHKEAKYVYCCRQHIVVSYPAQVFSVEGRFFKDFIMSAYIIMLNSYHFSEAYIQYKRRKQKL